jgi:hypothetical protein
LKYQSGYSWVSLRLEMRWSPSCQTNWAKATVTGGSSPSYNMAVSLQDTGGNNLPGTMWGVYGRAVYANMWYAPNQPLKACVWISGFGSDCTNAA